MLLSTRYSISALEEIRYRSRLEPVCQATKLQFCRSAGYSERMVVRDQWFPLDGERIIDKSRVCRVFQSST